MHVALKDVFYYLELLKIEAKGTKRKEIKKIF